MFCRYSSLSRVFFDVLLRFRSRSSHLFNTLVLGLEPGFTTFMTWLMFTGTMQYLDRDGGVTGRGGLVSY